MSFHEKSAWAMVFILLAGLAYYFNMVGSMSDGMDGLAPPVLPVVISYIVVIILLSIAGHILIAVLKPSDADDFKDERDKLIAARAGNISGVLLGIGLIWALGLYLFSYDGNLLFHGAFAALMVSQIADYAARIVYYRGGF